MSEIHALSGAYAIDALDDIERAQFERHLADCAECRAEVDSLREAAALLPETTSAVPSDALRERVLAGIATVRPLPPLAVEAPVRRRPRFRPAALVAAAAAVIALATGAVVLQPWDDSSQTQQISAADVLEAPDAESYVQEFPDGSKATLTRSKSLHRAVIVTSDMAPPPEGKVYELWLDRDGVMVPAGLMPADEADTVLMLEGDAADAQGAGITIEPEGGSEQPTGDTVALIPFENV